MWTARGKRLGGARVGFVCMYALMVLETLDFGG